MAQDSSAAHPLVTVIVPTYNAEDLVGYCLDSLVAQTIPKDQLEIIIVDDASTDATADICKSYADRYDFIRVICRETNSNHCAAPRNDGLAAASGDYLMFADADDWYGEEAAERLLNHAIYHDSDFVIGRNITANNAIYMPGTNFFSSKRTELIAPVLDDDNVLFQTVGCWSKLVKKSLIDEKGLKFDTLAVFEEYVWIYSILASAKNPVVVNDYDYYYFRRDTGHKHLTNQKKPRETMRPTNIYATVEKLLELSDEINSRQHRIPPSGHEKLFRSVIIAAMNYIDSYEDCFLLDGGLTAREWKQQLWDLVKDQYTSEIRGKLPLATICRLDAFEASVGCYAGMSLQHYASLGRAANLDGEILDLAFDFCARRDALQFLSDEGFKGFLAIQLTRIVFHIEAVTVDGAEIAVTGGYLWKVKVSDDPTLDIVLVSGGQTMLPIAQVFKPQTWGQPNQEKGTFCARFSLNGLDAGAVARSVRLRTMVDGRQAFSVAAIPWNAKTHRREPFSAAASVEKREKSADVSAERIADKQALASAEKRERQAKDQLKAAQRRIAAFESSYSWRIGRCVTTFPRAVKKALIKAGFLQSHS